MISHSQSPLPQWKNDSDLASVVAALNVNMFGAADIPTMLVSNASGSEDSAISLDIGASLGDLDGSESLAITISDVPTGAVLSAG